MLFPARLWPLIADGSLTLTFRRWERPRVLAGRRYRTPGGIVEVTTVEAVDPATVTDADARRAGHATAAELLDGLPGAGRGRRLFRIEMHLVDEPDPRATLAADARLSPEDVAEIDRRLDRLDRASRRGPWTREVLGLIAERPATRAADLAAPLGRETQCFKLDVRKLKNLGLTLSLEVGYRLSPRGEAYLTRRGAKTVAAETAVASSRTAPRVEHDRFRADLDAVAGPDAPPRA